MSRNPIHHPTNGAPNGGGRTAPEPVGQQRSRLDTLTALRALAAGRKIPSNKYQTLLRTGLVKVRGQGGKKTPVLTGRGTDVLRIIDAVAQQ